MNEERSGAAGIGQQVDDGVTAGMLLRHARERAGLHVAALAVALKVPVRKLEALEQDNFEVLPDAVFARALASSVCRTLKIDPQPVLDRLPRTLAPRLVQNRDGINAPFRVPSDGAGPSRLDQMSKPVFLAVFALLLGALVLIFLPTAKRDDAASGSRSDAESAPMPVVIPAESAADTLPAAARAGASTGMPSLTATVVMAPAATRATPAALTTALSTPGTASPTAVLTASRALAGVVATNGAPPGAGAAAAASDAGTVVFRTTGASWIEVTDGKGAIALRRLLAAGETAGASGQLPLAVTIGSANVTGVQVRGKVFDLAPVSRDNVARFEVR